MWMSECFSHVVAGVGQNVLISNFEAEAIASIFMKKESGLLGMLANLAKL